MLEYVIFIIAGCLGALIKDILEDNKIKLPKKINGELSLGFLGGVVAGGLVGYLTDGSFLASFLAGYSAPLVIKKLLPKEENQILENENNIENLIRSIAKAELVDPDLAIRVARCESNLNPNAININKDGSKDRGLYQINSKWHPEVSDEEAFDPVFSIKFFCKAYKEGHLDWWNTTKNCWKNP